VSLVEFRRSAGASEAVTGGAMDRVVVPKRRGKRLLIAAGAAGVLLLALLFYMLAPRSNSQTVETSRMQIATVEKGLFEDFLPLRGRVTPLLTVYLDAVEGGRVEQLAVEDGAIVAKGQLLAVLSNADLQLSTLARQTEVEQQLNNMRGQELALAQTRSSNRRELNQAEVELAKARRQYELYRPLAKKGFVSAKQLNDAGDDLNFQTRKLAITRQSIAQDEELQRNQLQQLRSSAASLNSGLGIARGSLSQLNLRAPVAGQLSGFSVQLGQSVRQGERLGQIDSAGRSKIVADVDEYYLGRVVVGQDASLNAEGKIYRMRVTKIYPQVRNGQFQIDVVFDGPEPPSLQRGQTLQAKLTLGDTTRATLLPSGAFFNDTGGNWVFVVGPDGTSATKRNVQIGRRNAEYFEVLSGLKAGERVIISSYSGLVDKDHLSFASDE
jgi:HlyD family secretion protein